MLSAETSRLCARSPRLRLLLGPLAVRARDLLARLRDAHAALVRIHAAVVLEEFVDAVVEVTLAQRSAASDLRLRCPSGQRCRDLNGPYGPRDRVHRRGHG